MDIMTIHFLLVMYGSRIFSHLCPLRNGLMMISFRIDDIAKNRVFSKTMVHVYILIFVHYEMDFLRYNFVLSLCMIFPIRTVMYIFMYIFASFFYIYEMDLLQYKFVLLFI